MTWVVDLEEDGYAVMNRHEGARFVERQPADSVAVNY